VQFEDSCLHGRNPRPNVRLRERRGPDSKHALILLFAETTGSVGKRAGRRCNKNGPRIPPRAASFRAESFLAGGSDLLYVAAVLADQRGDQLVPHRAGRNGAAGHEFVAAVAGAIGGD
jgi:hypothetical protein